MSQIAGRLAVLAGAVHLTVPEGGPGRLLSGALGVDRTRVVVIGAGVVGWNAARLAAAMGADVFLLDMSGARLQELEPLVPANVHLLYSSDATLEALLPLADLVIGAVLVPGTQAPRVLTRSMLKTMREGTVFVDVAIDQGGCAETSKATTHASPTYKVDGVIHYCVPNMPGAVPVTATHALTHATQSYVSALAAGVDAAVAADRGLAAALVSPIARGSDSRS
jgi:alanine dehydrogenase